MTTSFIKAPHALPADFQVVINSWEVELQDEIRDATTHPMNTAVFLSDPERVSDLCGIRLCSVSNPFTRLAINEARRLARAARIDYRREKHRLTEYLEKQGVI